MSFDWKKTLATVAPTIATALGGPLAGVAVRVASEALGVKPEEKAIEAAVASGDPELLLKLKQAENQFLIRLEELGVERERIAASDRSSARDLAKSNMAPQIILSALFILGYFTIIGVLLTGSFAAPEGFKEVLILLLGVLTREIPTIMQFWFGSSVGSKSKDAKKYDDVAKVAAK